MVEKEYNKFYNIRKVTWEIVNTIIQNNQNILKLLYYTNSTPLNQPDLDIDQIRNMICKDPVQEDTATKNILFQTLIDDGVTIAIPQLRIEIGDIIPLEAPRGAVEINFQVVIPNKQKIIVTDESPVDDRGLALFQEIAKTFNGTAIQYLSSPLYLDRRGNNGGSTGAYREKQNKNFSGYWITFMALC